MNNRRALLSASALVAPALLVACATATSNATVSAVFNAIQYILPELETLALGVSILFPAAAPTVAIVEPYLIPAASIFQGLSAAMTTVQALPRVQQIEVYLKTAFDKVQTAMGSPTAPPTIAKFSPALQKASAALALVTAFVNGVQALPSAAAVPLLLLHR